MLGQGEVFILIIIITINYILAYFLLVLLKSINSVTNLHSMMKVLIDLTINFYNFKDSILNFIPMKMKQ